VAVLFINGALFAMTLCEWHDHGRTPLLLGRSAAIAAVRADIEATARTDAKVLITGETGVGKEVVARSIHLLSARRDRAFIAVNCSGIPETLLESELFGHTRGSFTGAYRDKVGLARQAERGTLFLDELGEMSLRMQAVVLRFAETGEVQPVGADSPAGRANVRLITATNRDLRAQIAAGAFREDLYYRLNVIQIHIPPLRDRGEDILVLLEHFLGQAAGMHRLAVPTLTPDAAQLLLAYAWPGNVRELRNIAERLVLRDRARALTPDDLPTEILPDRAVRSSEPTGVAIALPRRGRATPTAVTIPVASPMVERLWERMCAGEDFWTVVAQSFREHELARPELLAIVDRGLRETRGSYRALLKVFNLPARDYKRLHAFLYQQECNLPVGPYREGAAPTPHERADAVRQAAR
jgi:DNA-binding NtrC family response regulator